MMATRKSLVFTSEEFARAQNPAAIEAQRKREIRKRARQGAVSLAFLALRVATKVAARRG